MAVGSYSQSELFDMMDSGLHAKSAQLSSRQRTLNRAVRFVLSDIDMKSMKRKAALSPNLFGEIYDYGAPANIKERAIIDLKRQVKRSVNEKFSLVDEEEFDREKGQGRDIFTIASSDLAHLLRIDGGKTTKVSIHNCDSLTANGTWAASADASNLTIDTENFIETSALNFDTAEGAATAVIELTGATQVDLTDHDEKSSIFVWVFIPDATDASGDAVTNFILRWGNDTGNFWSRTVTVNNEGVAFYDGWNLLRFDWNGATETGTVNPAQIDYVRLTITKPTTFAADTDWRVDSIVSRIGDIYDVIYYTRFGWQTSAGAYLEDATATSDLINAETDEIDMILAKAVEYGAQELKERDDIQYARLEYQTLRTAYLYRYPSERIRLVQRYYRIRKNRF